MLNPSSIIANHLADHISKVYMQYFGHRNPEYATYMAGAARLVLERIANSNALYHNVEHTLMVTLVGQQIIRGKLLSGSVTPEDWLHYTCALLVHDIGMVHGACSGDTGSTVVIDTEGNTFTPIRGATDACLAPFHIERGKIYVAERFGPSKVIDELRVIRSVEMTRFPVPDHSDYKVTDTEAALVRAADLIGQLADPFYHRKINALYAEFCETGMNVELGVETPSCLVAVYPKFFKSQVEPYIQTALSYLELTTEGKQWISNLYSNLYHATERPSCLGPFPGL